MPPVPPAEAAELKRWRADTPAAEAGRIHLNNAGAALMPLPVSHAIRQHLEREMRLGGYEAADEVSGRIARVYEELAGLVGAPGPHTIAVVENATVAFAQALSAFDPGPGDVIVTTRNDYASNQLMYLSLAERRGVEVVRAEDLPEGGVDPGSVRELVRGCGGRGRSLLVAVTWVPTNSGLIQPVAEIGRICAEHDVPFLVDACQAVGQMPVDAPALHCDFLAATGRKFLRGPRGTGFLYVSERALRAGLKPLHLDMRGADWTGAREYALRPDARRFENWEFAYALVMGLGEAAWYARGVGIDTAWARARALAALLRQRLAEIDGVRILDRGAELCAIVTADIAGRAAGDVVAGLREQGINTSAIDRVSAVLDMDDKGAATALRLSPHYYNTEAEVGAAVTAIDALVREA
ncbi:MAG TPA: aminotransferase class V-fold PLP-dependent enzyme [Longimicrobiales bacterium]|nr:aminotransferase class V-fold PLP-dependent enzyme [Longimicrobiales bacterium]